MQIGFGSQPSGCGCASALAAVGLAFGLLLSSCGGVGPYATETARCLANEEAILQRSGTTLEQDEADLRAERERCDRARAALRVDGGL